MSFDPITESIAHFAGAFELSEEAARARAEYDRFKAAKADEKEQALLDLNSSKAPSPYKLEGFDPAVDYKAPAAKIVYAGSMQEVDGKAYQADQIKKTPVPSLPEIQASGLSDFATWSVNLVFELAAPSSLIAVTYQSIWLSDNDIFGDIAGDNFASLEDVETMIDALADWAVQISPIRIDLTPSADNWYTAVKTVMNTIPQSGVIQQDALTVSVLVGADTDGMFVNGVEVEELPRLEDLLPAYFAAQIEPEDDLEEDEEPLDAADQGGKSTVTVSHSTTVVAENEPDAHDFENDFDNAASGNPAEDVEGHMIVAGANSMLNQTEIFSSWLDAPVLLVSGDVVKFDGISQANIIIDRDTGDIPDKVKALGSKAVNAAEIVIKDTLADPDPEDADKPDAKDAKGKEKPAKEKNAKKDSDDDETSSLGASPEIWAVTTVVGDVVQINWVDQFSFITDHDRADVSIEGANTFIGLGENTSLNAADFWEIGFGYDIIIIDGNMVDANIINQLNVLLDSDVVKSKGPAIETASLEGDDPDAEDALAGGISTADNLAFNKAEIIKVGEDLTSKLAGDFKDMADDFLAGQQEVSDAILANDIFDGTELLRVLHIKGNLNQVNVVNQTNVLGDADQVHLAADDFAAAMGGAIELTTGSNMQANIARITDAGQASAVQGGGEIYSDALIHQAELIDTDAAPAGVSLAELTSEAVAFLVDDMIQPANAEDIIASTNDAVAATIGSSDLMQQMLG